MPPPKRFTAYASFVLEDEVDEQVKAIAEREDVPPAVVFRRLLKNGLKAEQRRQAREAGR